MFPWEPIETAVNFWWSNSAGSECTFSRKLHGNKQMDRFLRFRHEQK